MNDEKRGRGRPKGPDLKPLHVKIKAELRDKIDDYRAKHKWTLRVAMEQILETFFVKKGQS